MPDCSIQKIELFIAFTYSAMSKKTTVERGGRGDAAENKNANR
jgi:hypothetical protein